jgi:hypothetical protein
VESILGCFFKHSASNQWTTGAQLMLDSLRSLFALLIYGLKINIIMKQTSKSKKRQRNVRQATTKINQLVSPETVIAMEDFRRNLAIMDKYSARRKRDCLLSRLPS